MKSLPAAALRRCAGFQRLPHLQREVAAGERFGKEGGPRQRLFAAGEGEHGIPQLSELDRDHAAHHLIVLDDQYRLGSARIVAFLVAFLHGDLFGDTAGSRKGKKTAMLRAWV